MNPEILDNHAALSATARRFLTYCIIEEKCLDRVDLIDESLPSFLRNYPYPLHSWPWFIGRDVQKTLRTCVVRIPELIYRAVRAEFGGDPARFAAFSGLPDVLAMIFLENGLDLSQLMLRADAIMTTGGMKILEINAGPSIGGWQIQWMDDLYRGHPDLSPFFNGISCYSRNIPKGYLDHVIRQGSICARDDDGSVNVVFIVRKEDIDGGIAEAMQDVFDSALVDNNCQGELLFEADFNSLRFDSHGVFLGARRISSVVSLSFSTAALGESYVAPMNLYRAFLRKQVFWPDNPFFPVISDKRSLAILHKHALSGLFSEHEQHLIMELIPWGASLDCENVTFRGQSGSASVISKTTKDFLVLKAARGAQGNDVFIGRHYEQHEWDEIVDRALSGGDWLVQEFCSSTPFYGQSSPAGYDVHDVIWGIFAFGNNYGGCWLRVAPAGRGNGVINSATGAQEAIVYEVED